MAGWSGGGRALMEFVFAYRERVRTLTLVEPAAYMDRFQYGSASFPHSASIASATSLSTIPTTSIAWDATKC